MNQCLLSWSRVCYINSFFLYSEFIQDTMWDIFHFFSWYRSGRWKVGRFSVLVFITYQIGSSTAPLLALAADPLNMTTYTSSSSPRMDSSVLNVTLPPSLSFLVSRCKLFSFAGTIKLDSASSSCEFTLWLRKWMISCPPLHVTDTSANQISNPDHYLVLWKTTDGRWLSCIAVSSFSHCWPHMRTKFGWHQNQFFLALFQALAFMIWRDICFAWRKSLKRRHILTYFREISHKLPVSGSPLEDEDLVFHTFMDYWHSANLWREP